MPRRRMMDPSFFEDPFVAKLTRDRRLFVVGCVRTGDDDGRLKAHPAYLKAEIFMYDDDIDLDKMREIISATLEQMETWPKENLWLMVPYENSGEDYLYFPNWFQQQKPSHPTPSKLPPPPESILPPSSATPELLTSTSGETQEALPKVSALGQSSLVKSSIVKFSIVKVAEDFNIFPNSESDLTDYLVTTLTKYISAGRARALAEGAPEKEEAVGVQCGIMVLEKFWDQAVGKMKHDMWQGAYEALKRYPPEVLARAFVKAARYQGGKYQKWKYLQTIIDEEMGKGAVN